MQRFCSYSRLKFNFSALTRSSSALSYVHAASSVPLSSCTIGEYLRQAAQRHPEREFVVFCAERRRRTYAQVYEEASRI